MTHAHSAISAETAPVLEAVGITKSFGDFRANDAVSFAIRPGEVHALLGENGAGKSTFVKLVYGLLQPDAGQFFWHGKPLTISGPQQARQLGIGMVFQHFSLFESLSVAENIQLALPAGEVLTSLSARIRDMSDAYGLAVDPDAYVYDLSVGQQQRVEVMRCLLQNPSLLIMDEPTSVLTPQETNQLFAVLRRFADKGMAVLFISHKLDEIRALTSRATVLRRGRNVGTMDTKGKSNRQLAELMVGSEVADINRHKEPGKLADTPPVCRITKLQRPKSTAFAVALDDISFSANAGEILAIAGISGNGQDELMAALSGEWQPPTGDVIVLEGKDISHFDPAARRRAGVGVVPEERNGHAAVPSMRLSDNALLTHHSLGQTVRHGVIDHAATKAIAAQIIQAFDVRVPNDDPMAAALSGGNLQKFVVGREILKSPRLLVVAQPTWGVDVGAAVSIRTAMLDLAANGSAVIMISQDLEEVFAIADKIAVLHDGRLSDVMPADQVTAEQIGLLMGGDDARRGASR
ncbi:MAG: ABC transporter ATP-binding protein [Candidatus Puniceispirillaceae bacterium]